MDTIFISDLRLDILIGVYDWERKVPQTVQLDLEIGIPDSDRPRSDRIRETIDYAKVIQRIQASLRAERFPLVERINLGGGNVRVAEQELHDAQVGAVVQQVRGEGVAQRVRRDRLLQTRLHGVAAPQG